MKVLPQRSHLSSALLTLVILYSGWFSSAQAAEWHRQNQLPENLRATFFVDVNSGYAVGEFGDILKTIDGGFTWTPQTSGTAKNLYGVFFLNVSLGYAVGEDVTVLKTIDGGDSWNIQTTETGEEVLNGVSFVDPSTGYTVGQNGTILKTTNGGFTWIPQTSGTSLELRSVFFSDASTGYVVGASGFILKTTDGGTNWTPQMIPDKKFNATFFVDATTGYAVGETGTILKRSDNGSTWTQQISGTTKELFGVYFLDASTGYVVGQDGTILKTTDRGTNWNSQTSGTTDDLLGAYFVNLSTGYAVGQNGTIVKTTNGGSTWVPQVSGTTEKLWGVNFLDTSTGYTTGEKGVILKTTDGGSNWLSQTIPAVNLGATFFFDSDTGFAVGKDGLILKTTTGGTPWIPQNSGTTADLFDIVFSSASIGYAVGKNGTIVKTIDGGSNWILQDSGLLTDLLSVSFADDVNGIAVGKLGECVKTTDGGADWRDKDSKTIEELRGVHFLDVLTAYTVGKAGTIRKMTDGDKWNTVVSGTTEDLNAVYFFDGSTGFVAGRNGTIRKTIDGGSAWADQNSGTTEDLRSLYFVDATAGFAAGDNGTIVKTTDGGANWVPQASGTTGHLKDVYVADALTGYVAGDAGIIRKTTDGGATWNQAANSIVDNLYDVQFLDATTGVVAGQGGTVLRTTDGGANWIEQTSGTTEILTGVHFADASTGFVVGNSGTVLKSSDGGSTWNPQFSGSTADLKGVYFASSTTGYATGVTGTILKTSDSGANWRLAGSPTSEDLTNIYALDALTGYVVGDRGTILATGDGGASWGVQTSGTTEHLTGVHFANASAGHVSGDKGTILKTINGGSTWTSQTSGTTLFLGDIHFENLLTGYAVGDLGTILKTTDGAVSWEPQTFETIALFRAVDFPAASAGFAVGNNGTVLKTLNGGAAWIPQNSGTTEQLNAVRFHDETTGYAAGRSGSIFKTTNGGSGWFPQITGTTEHLEGVYVQDADTVYAVGQGGTIIKTTDGGFVYNPQTSGTTNYLWAVHFISASTGYVVGQDGTILITTNGGTNWSPLTSGTTQDLFGVFFLNASIGLSVGQGGTILKTLDGGSNWFPLPSGTTEDLYDIHILDASTAYATGGRGTILETTDAGASWNPNVSGTTQHLRDVFFSNAATGYAVGEQGAILSTKVAAANDPPTVASAIPDTIVTMDSPPVDNYRDLNQIFTDPEDGGALAFSVKSNSNPGLLSAIIDADSALDLSFAAGQNGTAAVIIRATDSGGLSVEDTFVVEVTDSYVLSPVQDSYLKESAPSDNYGSDAELLCKNKSSDDLRPVLQFDLSTLPFRANVVSAVMHLWVTQSDVSGSPVNIYRITDPWIEGTVTWQDAASRYDTTAVHGEIDPSFVGWVTVDISALVQGWVDGSHPNNGLMLLPTSTDEESKYASREWGTPGERPRLEIVTSGIVNEVPGIISAIPDTTVAEDSPPIDNYRDLNAVFDDAEDGSALGFSIVSNSNPGVVSAVIDADSALDLSFAVDQSGSATLVIRATDSGFRFVEDTLVVAVNAVNDPITVTAAIPDTTVAEDNAPLDNYRDLNSVFDDVEDGGALTFSIESNSNPGVVSSVIDADSALDFSFAADQNGSATIVVRAADSGSLFVEDTLVVTVTAVNDQPTVASAIADTVVYENSAPIDNYRDLNAVFADIEDSTALTFTIEGNTNPSLVTAVIDADSAVDLSIAVGQTGSVIIIVGAADSGGLTVTDTFELDVVVPPSPAGMQIATGSYTGDGIGNRAINDVDFEPDFVIIKGENTMPSVARTSTMIGDASKRLGQAFSIIADRIQALTPDGFLVGSHDDVNETGFEFHWTAFKAAPGALFVGTYLGDGTDNRSITGVGFQPDYVIIMSSALIHAVQRFPSQVGDATFRFDENPASPNLIQAFEADGFRLGDDDQVNRPGIVHHYLAFQTTVATVAGDRYTGNGFPNRDITGLGLRPEYVIIKSENNRYAAHRSNTVAARTLTFVPGEPPFADGIDGFLADGFRVGDHRRVNNPFEDYHWVAFRGNGKVDADLDIAAAVNNLSPSEQDTIDYTVTLVNNGPGDASSVLVTDLLPGGVTHLADTLSQGVYTSASGLWTVGTLAVSDTATLIIKAVVDPGTMGSTIDNIATVTSSDQIDPVSSNNTAMASILVLSPNLSTEVTLVDSAGTLIPPLAFENDPVLTLHIGLNNLAILGVMLDTTSTITFSDSVHAYTAKLANSTYVPRGAQNFTVAFQSAPLPAGLTAPGAYDLTITLSGVSDSSTAYSDTIITTGRNSILIDTPKIALQPLPLDVEVTLPGTRDAPILVLDFHNGYADVRNLDSLTITNTTIGAGTQTQLDAEIELLRTYDDVDSSGSLSPPDTIMSLATFSGGQATFALGGRWELPGFGHRALIITADVDSLLARDDDALNAALMWPADVVFQQSSTIDSSFSALYPLDSFGRLVIDGMAAYQVRFLPSVLDTLNSGTVNNWLFTLVVPQNGYQSDTLTALSIKNYAPDFDAGDIAAYRLYRDTGNGTLDLGLDEYLGTMVYSGARIEISGLNVPASPTTTFFVAVDVSVDPTSGSHFRPGVPVDGIEMHSTNDGPVDQEIISTQAFTLRTVEEIAVENRPLQPVTVNPGSDNVAFLLFSVDNNTLQTIKLDTLTLVNMSVGPGSVSDLDKTLSNVKVYQDDGNGVVDSWDPLIVADLAFSSGLLTIADLDITFSPNELRYLLVTSDIDSFCSRDSDSLRLELPSAAAVGFDQAFAIKGSFPMSTMALRKIDGMMAHQAVVTPSVDSLVIDGGSDILVFDVGLPANGYEIDTLRSLEIENLGSASSEHFTRLSLYLDGGDGSFDGGSVDDIHVGDLIENITIPGGRHYQISGLTTPLSTTCEDLTRLFLAADITEDYTVGGSIQFSVPLAGLQVASGNDGPIDEPIVDPSLRLVPKPDQLTIFPYSVGDQTVYPGSEKNLNFGIGLYNGYAFPLQLEKIKLHQVGTASNSEIDGVFAFADVDTNGLFDAAVDSLIAASTSLDLSHTLDGFTLNLPSRKISYVFVSYDLPLAVRDLVTVDLKLFDAEGIVVVPSADIRSDFPINSPGMDVTDGMIVRQVELLATPSFRVAPDDRDVLAMALTIPPNGVWPDELNTVSIANLGTARAGDDVNELRLWKEAGGDTSAFDPGEDESLAILTWTGSTWVNPLPLHEDIPAGGLRCYVTFSVSDAPTDGVTFKASVPIHGIQVESANDGPIDAPLVNTSEQSISTDPLITSLRLNRNIYSVGQTISLVMEIRNEGADTLRGVTPSPLTVGGSGGVSLLSGPTPPVVDLMPGGDTAIVWTYSADSAGDISFCGFAHDQDSLQVSKPTCSDPARNENRASDVFVSLTNLAPATANRGQDNVTLAKLRLSYDGFDSLSAPVILNGMELGIEDGNGVPLSPNTVLDGMTFQVVNGLNRFFSLADSTSNPLRLMLSAPIVIDPGDSITLMIDSDLAGDAAFTAYRLAVALMSSVQVLDANDGAAAPMSTANTFPWQTTDVLINERAESLLVSSDTPSNVSANFGQDDVHLFSLSFLNPGGANTAGVVVTGLAISLFDTTGSELIPSHVMRRLRVDAGAQTLLTTSDIPEMGNEIDVTLSTPLIAPPGIEQQLDIYADLSDVPQTGAFYTVVAGASAVAARDINTDQLVAISALDPVIADFPLSSNRILIEAPATGLQVTFIDRLPTTALPSTNAIPAMDIALTHADTSLASILRVDSVALYFRHPGGNPIFPGDYFSALYVVHAGDTISANTSLSSSEPVAECAFTSPVAVAPDGGETFSVLLDSKALFAPTEVEVWLDQNHLVVRDGNDGSRLFGLSGVFPIVAGPTKLQMPSNTVHCGMRSRIPQNVGTTDPDIEAFDLLLENNSPAGHTSVALTRLAVNLHDTKGNNLDPRTFLGNARLIRGDSLVAEGQLNAGDITFAIPANRVLVGSAGRDTLTLVVNIDAQVADVSFRFVITDSASSHVVDVVTGDSLAVGTINNTGYPLKGALTHVLGTGTADAFTNYPNPFAAGRETTRITYYLPQTSTVTLKLYTVWGAFVRTLIENQTLQPGLHQDIAWNGHNADGDLVSNGAYLLILEVRGNDGSQSKLTRKVGVLR